MTHKIAIIAAHPDDEALGCGGTILKHKKAGHEIHFLFMTNGVAARQNIGKKEIEERSDGLQKSIDFLSPTSCKLLDYPDNKLDTVPLLEITKDIENFLEQVKPDIIFTHFFDDLNIDHRITCQATITACRPGSKTFIKEILAFEVPSSTNWNLGATRFMPNYFVDISNVMKEKLSYLRCYEKELRDYPHARSYENIKALSQLRGSEVFVNYAEAFMLVRSLKYDV